jgi:SAM-dependent methyltransferase
VFIADIFESYVAESATQLVVLYPGRFQPFHLGHKDVFTSLQNKFGRNNVYISTSNKVDPPRSPFNFSEKIQFMYAADIHSDRIIESSMPYSLPPQFDPKNTILILAVGAPDYAELDVDGLYTEKTKTGRKSKIPAGKKVGDPKPYKSFEGLENCTTADQHIYIIMANERKKVIQIDKEKFDVSHGSMVRDIWVKIRNNPQQRQQFVVQLYGQYNPEIDRLLDKIQSPEQVTEDVPPPENARKTQIAGTLGTYKKASDIFKQHGVQGKALDFGAGLGKGTAELGKDAESYEPFPNPDFKPHFVDVTKIPDNSYKRIVNLNVLNVVPNLEKHRIRDEIVRNIGRVLAPGGVAIITTRGRDVLTIKGTPGEEPMSMISSIGTYQKGFTQVELREYIASVLGDGFEVKSVKLGPAGVMIKKLESIDEGLSDNPNFVAWFRDSKIVDKDGNPLKVYHGTFADIHAFKSRSVERNFGNAQRLLGHFFTPDTAYASQYASTGTYGKFGGNVVPVYLSIQNPKIEDISMMDEIETRWSDRRLRKYKNNLIQNGHDGIIFTNHSGIYEIVAFSNKQIKSAVGNKGTYDINKSKLVAEELDNIVAVIDGVRSDRTYNDKDHAHNSLAKLVSYGKAKVAELYVNGEKVEHFEIGKKYLDFEPKKLQELSETFNQPYSFTWSKGDHGDYDAWVRLPDNTVLEIMFNDISVNTGNPDAVTYEVEFHRDNSQDITNQGDAYKIFATVLHAIKEFLKMRQPDNLIFSATKDVESGQNEESRTKLYDRMIGRYTNTLGYDSFSEDHGNYTEYQIYKRTMNEDAGGVGVVKNSKDPRYVMATMGDQNDVTAATLPKMMAGYHLTKRYKKLKEEIDVLKEKWSAKYKRSINCSNPKGFSQRAHCQGRKKK